MREIKFRAWDKEQKKMWDMVEIEASDKDGVLMWGEIFSGKEPQIELMQFTGLKDRHGREIYEGDLIRTDGFSLGMSLEVVWREFGFQLGEHGISPLYNREREYDIVGNRYENPELLKA